MVQIGEIEHQFGNACRFAIPTQGFLQAVGLGWNVVDADDRGGLFVLGRGPAAILLVDPAFVYGRLDGAARPRQRLKFRVDADTVIERVAIAASQQRFEIDRATHGTTFRRVISLVPAKYNGLILQYID